MPLVRFEVRNEFALGQPELYNDCDREEPKAVLDAVAVSGLVGILRQLGDLAEFAAEVFHGLQEQITATSSRSYKLRVRVQSLEAKLPSVEKAVLAQTSHLHFAYTAGCEWRTRIRNEQNNYISDDLPRFIMDSYEECRHPPRLHLLDRFDTGGPGSCLKRYSDPAYFKRVSGRFDEASLEDVQRNRKARKIKKKRSSRKNKEISRAASSINHRGRMQMTTPAVDDQLSPQCVSMLDKTSKYDIEGSTYSFDSRSGSGHNEYFFHPCSAVQPLDQENRESSSPRSMRQHDKVNSVSSRQETGVGDEYSSHCMLPEPSAPTSSSVQWEEKIEIVESLQNHIDETPENLCTNFEVQTQEKVAINLPCVDQTDIGQCNVQKQNFSENQYTNSEQMQERASFQKVDQINVINDDEHTQTTLSEKIQNDEIESDLDDFVDALNTIESESENELDSQSVSEVSKYSTGINDKGTERPQYEHVAHSSDHHPSIMESNNESIILADIVADEQVISSPEHHPSNMMSNSGHVVADRDEHMAHSPDRHQSCTSLNGGFAFAERDKHVVNSPDHHQSNMESNSGFLIFEGKDADQNVVYNPEYHPSNMESDSGFLILEDKDADQSVVYNPECHPSNMESNSGFHVLADDDADADDVVHSPDHHQSNMDSNSGFLILADKDADQNVVYNPECSPSNMESNSGFHVLADKDADGNVVCSPDCHRTDMESYGGSCVVADSDAHEFVVHNSEFHPSNRESDSGFHIVVGGDAHEHMLHSPDHHSSTTESNYTTHDVADKDAHNVNQPYNMGSETMSKDSADRDSACDIPNSIPSSHSLPSTVPSYDLPNSVASSNDLSIPVPASCDSPNSVSSKCDFPNLWSNTKEKMPQNAGKSFHLVHPSGAEPSRTSNILDDSRRDPIEINPLSYDSRISDLLDSSGAKTTSGMCTSLETLAELNSGQFVTFWTNGGLLGLQPSKPPDTVVINSTNQESLKNCKEETDGPLVQNHMLRGDDHKRCLAELGEKAEISRDGQSFGFKEVLSDDQTDDVNIGGKIRSDPPSDSTSKLKNPGDIHCDSHFNFQTNGLDITSIGASTTDTALAPAMTSSCTDANQGFDGKSSQSFGLGHRLLLSGFSRKMPPVHNDKPDLLRIVQDNIPHQSSMLQNCTHRLASESTSRGQLNCGSPTRSLTSSPPLEHINISFHPINDFQVSRLKLKILDGSHCLETGDTFSSFQLVPENAAPLHDIGSDSDDNTFCRSSPYISDEDDHLSDPSDSNSEMWESSETPEIGDRDLYNALGRISLMDSTSGSSELRAVVIDRTQVDGGITNPCSENDAEHSLLSTLLDLPNFDTVSHEVKHRTEDVSHAMALLALQTPRDTTPMPPPLPPGPLRYIAAGTTGNAQHFVSEAFKTAFDLQSGGSAVTQKLNQELFERQANVQTSLLVSKIKEQKSNGQREADWAANGKGMDEREDFLHQIRTRSFSLRPTVTARPTVTPAANPNIKVTAILEKANAIRQAVGSEGEDDDTWSDA